MDGAFGVGQFLGVGSRAEVLVLATFSLIEEYGRFMPAIGTMIVTEFWVCSDGQTEAQFTIAGLHVGLLGNPGG